MAARVVSVPFGPPATRALIDLVAELRGGDPFAPLTVTAPSAAAGTTLRRALAAAGGTVGVTVESLPQLAARLAGPALAAAERPPLPAIMARGHLRAALRAEPGRLAAAASPATERALERSLAELADLDDDQLAALSARGGTTADVVALARRVRAATADHADAGDTVRAAVAAVADGRAPLSDVGPVVVHLPRRLRPPELRLLAALATRHTVAVTVGRTGDAAADTLGAELLAALTAVLGVDADVVPGAAEPPVPTELLRAPDPAEEAAVAARLVAAALAEGTRPERVAVLYRVRDPYAAVVHEQLAAAGIAHHAPAVRTLAQSVAGRVLLGALALGDGRFRRSDVVAWWRSGPVRDLATGGRVRVSWWDRLAREAGITGGLDQWRQRLDQAAAARRAWLDQRPPAPDGALPELDDRRLTGYAALAAAVAALAQRLAPPADTSWRGWSRWAGGLLDAALGGERTAEGWPDEERDARAAVAAAVASLAALDGIDDPPDLRRVRHVLERELEQPARSHGRFGHGVAVGRVVDAVGADLDLVIVVGAAEGQLPPRRRDDALIPDRDRRAGGGALAPRGRTRDEEARDLFAALAAAPRRVLVAPRSDPRAQRERQPAPAFLDACSTRAGRLVASTELDALRAPSTPWFTDVESFEWWPGGGRSERIPTDVDLAALLTDHRAGRPVTDSAAAIADGGLRRGLDAAMLRRSGTFGAWSGNVGSRPDLLDGFDEPRSPTGLEQYARCPFRFFLGHILGVSPLDDPTDAEVMSGRDLGSLVHGVLERFMVERGIGKPPDEPWSDDDRRRLLAIADEAAGLAAAEGRTGKALLWGVRWEQWRRQLLGILDADERMRAERGASPIAVELGFGIDDDDPVVLDVADGRRVAFRGMIDRVDRSADGRRLLVVDYKTGSDFGYDVDDDMTARGQKLQLGIYALAARRAYPDVDEVESRYWFVERPGPRTLRGGVFDAAAEARLRDVVTTVLDGIVAGRFPANPGDESWDRGRYVHGNCKYCEFERVCPTTRGWAWQRTREVPELADYVALAEAADVTDVAEGGDP